MSRFVLLGGTFDPVHVGHLALAREASRLLAARAVLVVEAGHRHRGEPVASLADRRHLVQQAVAGEACVRESTELGLAGDLVAVVAALAGGGHDLHVAFGADSARHLDRWRGSERLSPAHLWVIPRGNDDGRGITGVGTLDVHVADVSATQIRFALASGHIPVDLVPAGCLPVVQRMYAPASGISCATA